MELKNFTELKDWQRKLIDCIIEGGWRSCPEEIRQMFDEISLAHMDYAWEGCGKISCQVIKRIIVSERLILEVYNRSFQKPPKLPLPELRRQMDEYDYRRLLVIGYNGDKLFVNLINSMNKLSIEKCVEVNGVEVCRVERDFDYLDMDYEKVVVTPEILQHGLPLRVQGDLTIEYARSADNLADVYVLHVRDAVHQALRDLVELALARAGLEFERGGANRYIIEAYNAGMLGAKAVARALNQTLSEHVLTRLDGSEIWFNFGVLRVNHNKYSRRYMCDIRLDDDIDNDISKLDGIFRQFVDAYHSVISNLQRVDVQMRIGNHFVEIRNTYPQSIMFTATLKIGGVKRTYLLTAVMPENHFYADGRTRVTIRHHEHGEVSIEFTVPGIYAFGHVPHRRDARLSNTLAIRRLIRSFMDPKLGYVYEWNDLVEAVYAFGRIETSIEIEIDNDEEDMETYYEDNVKNTLAHWIKRRYDGKILFGKDNTVVISDEYDVLIRYEIRNGKIIIKSFERP